MGAKVIAKNKRASFDYQLLEKFEAGLVLVGTEVKSLRQGHVTLSESYISVDRNQEVWVYNLRIPHYEFGNRQNHDETRNRKLLLNKKEIARIDLEVRAKGLTIVPTALIFKGPRVKIEFALAKGKKLHDKRHDLAKKDAEKKIRKGDY